MPTRRPPSWTVQVVTTQSDLSYAVWALAMLSGVFALKHYSADFVFQPNAIARGKEQRQGWLIPLGLHVGIHAAMTLGIVLLVKPRLWWLAIADLAAHFVIDRCKTLVAHWGKWSVDNERFWWQVGADQLLHQLTNLGLAAALVLL